MCSCEVSASDEAKQMSAEVKDGERQTDREVRRAGKERREDGGETEGRRQRQAERSLTMLLLPPGTPSLKLN